MEKLSDPQLIEIAVLTGVLTPGVSRVAPNLESLRKFEAEILKRMGNVDVAAIAREIYLETEGFTPLGKQCFDPTEADMRELAKIESILRSHLEGKSE